MPALQKFLSASRRALLAGLESPSQPLPIVLGNEACDLDSFASSLLYAYLSHFRPRPIPLLAIPSADLALRPDIVHLLSLLSLAPSDLLFSPDYAPRLVAHPGLRLHLVDHNVPTGPLKGVKEEQVVGIVDHHEDEGFAKGAEVRKVLRSGSCTSLAINEFWSNAGLDGSEEGEEEELKTCALGPIMVDTAGMRQRVTEHDKVAVKALGGVREELFRELMEAKERVDDMSGRDLMRRDWKEWDGGLGIASMVKDFEWLVGRDGGKDGFLQSAREWAEEREVEALGVMTSVGAGTDRFKRELMVWGLSDRGVECVKKLEEKAGEAGLQLDKWRDGGLDLGVGREGYRRAWKQGNIKMSRKQVAPLLRECYKAAAAEVSKPIGAKV